MVALCALLTKILQMSRSSYIISKFACIYLRIIALCWLYIGTRDLQNKLNISWGHLHVLYNYTSTFTKCYSFLKYNNIFSCPEFQLYIEQPYFSFMRLTAIKTDQYFRPSYILTE